MLLQLLSDIQPDRLRRSGRDPECRQSQGTPSGMESRLFAESSSVRSNHWEAEVIAGFKASHHHITGQGCNSLAAHRVSLICHRRGADLILFKGLFHFFQVLQQTDIVGHLMCGLAAMPASTLQHSGIYFTGIGLSGYRIAYR